MRNLLLALTVCVAFAPSPTRAHEGHAHEDDQESVAAPPAELRLVGEGESFDAALESFDEGKVRLYVFDRETNEPVAGATVSLQPGDGASDAELTAASESGVYEGTVAGWEPRTQHVTVQTATDADIIELIVPAYLSSPAAPSPGGASHSHGPPWRVLAGALGGFLVGVLLMPIARRLRGRGPVAALVIAVSVVMGERIAEAHEGHDHGADSLVPANEQAGSAVVLAKRAQLLLGLRTLPVRAGPIPGNMQAVGHIVAKPQNDAVITAPQAGFVRGLRGLLPGASIRRGEAVASLQAVASIPLTSPIDGEVMEVDAVEGGRVEAGARIARITNTSVLWVDAELFQDQLARLGEVEGISVAVDGWPSPVEGRLVHAPMPINEQTRTGKAFLELAEAPKGVRLGSFVRVYFRLKAQGTGIEVPRDAILNRAGERLVFVKSGPETFEPRPVLVKEGARPQTMVVTHGLVDGDRIVTRGNYQLLMKAR